MNTKRNSIEIGVKGLILAVTVIIAVILSALALYMANTSKSTINSGTTQYTQLTSEYSEINATMYDGLDVSGAKVVEVIKDMAKEGGTVKVTVKTKLNTAGVSYQGSTTTYTLADSPTDNNHINETGTFRGEVVKNDNQMVTEIIFTQH